MDDEIDTLMVEVRASTQGFAADIETMRSSVDTTLLDGFEKAGRILERGLLKAIRTGSLGFEDLKRMALQVLDQIAAHALQMGLDSIFRGIGKTGDSEGIGGLLSGGIGAILGLPGRATGGPVSPGRGYVVGERGPELFVPTSAGRVEPQLGRAARDVRVAISLNQPRGATAPTALRRSSRQVASAVRRALSET